MTPVSSSCMLNVLVGRGFNANKHHFPSIVLELQQDTPISKSTKKKKKNLHGTTGMRQSVLLHIIWVNKPPNRLLYSVKKKKSPVIICTLYLPGIHVFIFLSLPFSFSVSPSLSDTHKHIHFTCGPFITLHYTLHGLSTLCM